MHVKKYRFKKCKKDAKCFILIHMRSMKRIPPKKINKSKPLYPYSKLMLTRIYSNTIHPPLLATHCFLFKCLFLYTYILSPTNKLQLTICSGLTEEYPIYF